MTFFLRWLPRLWGFAFALGVLTLAIRRNRQAKPWRVLDAVALGASVVLPVGMSIFTAIDGVLQRLMFLVAYLWYLREAVSCDHGFASRVTGSV